MDKPNCKRKRRVLHGDATETQTSNKVARAQDYLKLKNKSFKLWRFTLCNPLCNNVKTCRQRLGNRINSIMNQFHMFSQCKRSLRFTICRLTGLEVDCQFPPRSSETAEGVTCDCKRVGLQFLRWHEESCIFLFCSDRVNQQMPKTLHNLNATNHRQAHSTLCSSKLVKDLFVV